MKEFYLISKENQLKTSLDESALITASAGTGKTYTITGIFLRLLLEKKISARSILVVTFTNKAAIELKSRIRLALLNLKNKMDNPKFDLDDHLVNEIFFEFENKITSRHKEKIQETIRDFDFISIDTIHSFCQKIIQEYAFESDVNYEMILSDAKEIQLQLMQDFYRKNFQEAAEVFLKSYAYSAVIKDLEFILKKTINYPNIKILPNAIDEDIIQQILNLISQFNKNWNSNKEVICDENHLSDFKKFFFEDKIFSGTYIKKPSVRNNLDLLQQFCSLEEFPYDKKIGKKSFLDVVFYFSIDNLQGKLNKNKTIPQCKLFLIFQEFYENIILLNDLFVQYKLYIQQKWIDFSLEELIKRKQIQNIITFQDMINITAKAVQNRKLLKSLQEKYSVALIDEFQDTDPIQYKIFNRIFNSNSNKHLLYFIGDPKQSIYRFRGADIFAYFDAIQKIKNKYTLKTNYRSTSKCIDAVNTIFSHKNNSFIFTEIQFEQVNAASSKSDFLKENQDYSGLHITLFENTKQPQKTIGHSQDDIKSVFSKQLIKDIKTLINNNQYKINNRNVNESDITVLVKTNTQAIFIQEELSKKNIKSIIFSKNSVWHSEEAIQIKLILEAIMNYDNTKAVVRALSTDIIHFSAFQIYKLFSDEQKELDDSNSIEKIKILETLKESNQLWLKSGVYTAIQHLFTSYSIETKLFQYKNAERKFTNIHHILELLQKEEGEKNLSQIQLLKFIEEKIKDSEENEDAEIRLESEEKSITIMTIHKSKGLEFNIVFLPFLYESSPKNEFVIYHEENKNELVLNLMPQEKDKLLAQKEERAEKIRNFYVALTRAKYKTFMYWGMLGSSYKENSIFQLLHKETKLFEDVLNDIQDLSKKSNDSISYSLLTKDDMDNLIQENILEQGKDKSILEKKEKNIKIQVPLQINKEKLRSNFLMSSYSSLVHSQNHLLQYSSFYEKNLEVVDQVRNISLNDEKTIFDFPKGAIAGNTIHTILERIDFQNYNSEDSKQLIQSILEVNHFNIKESEQWHYLVIYRMIKNLLKQPLFDNQKFSLRHLTNENKIHEMEFLFHFNQFQLEEIYSIIQDELKEVKNINIDISENIGFQKQGYIKGFIDLVFTYDNQYFIVDWKSNYLGSNIEDYNQEKMLQVMNSNQYFLQYYIYVLALHRFLKQNIKDYSYEQHIGGVFYFFVRGVFHDTKNGIYFHLPKKESIEQMNQLLLNEEKIVTT